MKKSPYKYGQNGKKGIVFPPLSSFKNLQEGPKMVLPHRIGGRRCTIKVLKFPPSYTFLSAKCAPTRVFVHQVSSLVHLK